MNYEIDREKRGIIKSFRTVIKTSGASDLGIPPANDKDTDFEKCPSYMQGLKLSNKRLLEWRECEKKLHNFIKAHEAERSKDKCKRKVKKSEQEYTIIPSKRFDDIEDDVFLDDTTSIAASEKTSPVDLLKENPDNKDEKFDIKKWEADIIESYKTVACTHVKPTVQNGGTSGLRSKSSPTISARTNDFNSQQSKRVRPHTAQARIRPPSGRSSVSRRPASASTGRPDNQSKFLITKNSTYMRTGHTFEKLLDNRPIDKPLMVNNYLNSLKPPSTSMNEKEPSIASVGTLCPVVEGDEDEDAVQDNDNPDGHTSAVNGENVESINGTSDQTDPQAESAVTGLSLKFQKRLKKKLLRARSARSGLGSHFKHSNSDLSSYIEGSSRRSRHDSESASSMVSMPMSRTGSIVSSHRPSISLGIPSDIEDMSRVQEKLASEITAEKPLSTNKLVSITKVVRAAMTFSRMARKRALTKMQDENSSDAHEIIRQERLRKLLSRQQVLNSIASQWQSENRLDDLECNIQQVE